MCMFEVKIKHKTAAKEGREAASNEDVEEEQQYQQMSLERGKCRDDQRK